jgi:hypothetical protein
MRKLILILAVLIAIPAATFAEWGFGGAALYKSPVLIGQDVDTSNLNVNQFSFGGDARLKLGWFQAEALLVYSAGDTNSLSAFLDAGVALDLAILRLSLGAGPNFNNNFGESKPIQAGLNAKLGADVMLGKVSLGLTYLMAMNLDNGVQVTTKTGLVGAQILIWM